MGDLGQQLLDVPTAADWLIDSWVYQLAFSIKSHKIGITKITTHVVTSLELEWEWDWGN